MKNTGFHVSTWVLLATVASVTTPSQFRTARAAEPATIAQAKHQARLPAGLYDASAATHDAMVGYPAVMILDMEIGPTDCKINGAIRPNAPTTKPTRFDVVLLPKGDRESLITVEAAAGAHA